MIRNSSWFWFAAGLLAVAAFLRLAPCAAADDDRIGELERKVDVLTSELEQLRLGAAADTGATVAGPRHGLGPSASKVYGAAHGVSLGGYGEMLYENFDRQREDGTAAAALDRLDLLRIVFYVGHKFSDELLLNSEVEFEHAGVTDEGTIEGTSDPLTGGVTGESELSGEAVVEFAYLEWSRRPAFGVRAGMLLVPVGLTNEQHEPPVFIGARRSDVEQIIIPTTWSANGVGAIGEFSSGLSYRLYLTEGLNGARFSAQGIRKGRQGGSQSLFTQPAVTGRLDYAAHGGATIGASFFAGNTWQDFQPTAGTLAPRLSLIDVHGRIDWHGLQARALYAHGSLTEASDLSDALGLTGSDRLGETFFGVTAEASYDLLGRLAPGSSYALLPYARWENYDTQNGVPGGSENPALERTVWTAGAAFRPHPNVIVKADRQWRSNQADTGTDQWNVAFGYMF
jgi:hypothetical protein